MRRVLVGLLVTVVAALGAGSAAPTPTTTTTVKALVWQGRTLSLATLDARRLAPRSRLLPLGRAHGEVFTDALGERLAVASAGVGIVVIDTRRMKVLWRVQRGRLVRAVTWLSPSRLLVAEHGGVLLLDPVRKRLVSRADHESNVVEAAQWRSGLVLLAERGAGRIEPARLVIVGPGVRMRTITLDRIMAGVDGGENNQGPFRRARPALAVDAMTGKAFVAGGPLVATVDLSSLSFSYRGSERTLQKIAAGPRRSAALLSDGTLAVSGEDAAPADDQLSLTSAPFGLRYVRGNGVSIVDERATDVSIVGELALAYGQWYSNGRAEGSGLAAYDTAGALRWRLFGTTPVTGVQVANGLGYVWTAGRWDVIDLTSGAVVGNPSKPRWDFFRVLD